MLVYALALSAVETVEFDGISETHGRRLRGSECDCIHLLRALLSWWPIYQSNADIDAS